jgi:hypothetical protein
VCVCWSCELLVMGTFLVDTGDKVLSVDSGPGLVACLGRWYTLYVDVFEGKLLFGKSASFFWVSSITCCRNSSGL